MISTITHRLWVIFMNHTPSTNAQYSMNSKIQLAVHIWGHFAVHTVHFSSNFGHKRTVLVTNCTHFQPYLYTMSSQWCHDDIIMTSRRRVYLSYLSESFPRLKLFPFGKKLYLLILVLESNFLTVKAYIYSCVGFTVAVDPDESV